MNRRIFAAAGVVLGAFLMEGCGGGGGGDPGFVELVGRAPGVSAPDSSTLLSAFLIVDEGNRPAEDVIITSMSLPGGTLLSPLPVPLGTIPPEGGAQVEADFTGGPFLPDTTLPLLVSGSVRLGGKVFPFALVVNLHVPPAAPGSDVLNMAMITPMQVTGAPFPPVPPDFDEDEENEAGWTVPTGPFVAGVPTLTMTGVQMATEGPGPVIFHANDSVGFTGGNTIAEPSGASGGGVVFITTNTLAAFSTTGGPPFTQIDPSTIFPNDAVGLCCDQIVQYLPSIDRFVWLLQGNGYRLAAASPAAIMNSGGTAWTYWNLTPGVFGFPAGSSLDYPDLSVGSNMLYMCWDASVNCDNCGGFQVVRTSLTGIQAAGTITIEFTDPAKAPMAWGSHLTQNTGDEIFWAGHNTNSEMRVFSAHEASNMYFWRDVGVSSWANDGPKSLTPDGRDWIAKNFDPTSPLGAFPRNGVIGGTRTSNDLVWFAWTAGTDANFPEAHIEIVTLDVGNNYAVTQQVQIWNPDFAFAYPALATNACSGEVGLSLEYGGGGNYENHAVGFWGDFLVYVTTSSNVGTRRFGDYVTLRREPATSSDPGNLFTAFGYGLNLVGGASYPDVHHVVFGRPPSVCGGIPGDSR